MVVAQGDAFDLTTAPDLEVAVDLHMAGVEAEAGEDGQPFVQDGAVPADVGDGLDAGGVDEGRQEAVAEVSVFVALASQPDYGLGRKPWR